MSALGLDQTMFVRDLNLGDKYTMLTRGEVPVAVVKSPDDVPGSAPGAAAASAAPAAPEVIKKGKEEAADAAGAKKEEKK